MAVSFVTANNTTTSSALTSLTINSLTTSGSSGRALAIAVSQRFTTVYSVSSVTRTGDTYDEKVEAIHDVTRDELGAIWGSTNEPGTSAQNLTVTLTSAGSEWGIIVAEFDGVDISGTPFGSTGSSAAATEGSATLTLTDGASGDMVVVALAIRGSVTDVTDGSGMTGRDNWDTGTSGTDNEGYLSTKDGANPAAVDYSWTDAHNHVICAVMIFAASAGAADTMLPEMMHRGGMC